MKGIKLSLICILFLLCQDSTANTIAQSLELNSQPKKGIQIVHKKGKKSIPLIVGQKVKIWDENDIGRRGEITAIGNRDLQVINKNGETISYKYDDISKFRVVGEKKIWRIVGSGLVIVGAGAMVLGGISLVAGFVALASESLGAVILVAVPVLGGLGYATYALGNRVGGRKVSLKKNKWSFQKLDIVP